MKKKLILAGCLLGLLLAVVLAGRWYLAGPVTQGDLDRLFPRPAAAPEGKWEARALQNTLKESGLPCDSLVFDNLLYVCIRAERRADLRAFYEVLGDHKDLVVCWAPTGMTRNQLNQWYAGFGEALKQSGVRGYGGIHMHMMVPEVEGIFACCTIGTLEESRAILDSLGYPESAHVALMEALPMHPG